jgi:hypothetical protein
MLVTPNARADTCAAGHNRNASPASRNLEDFFSSPALLLEVRLNLASPV